MHSTIRVSRPRTLYIPTINEDDTDYNKLFCLQGLIKRYQPSEIIVNFSRCRFLRQNAVAFLGGLARQVEAYGGNVEFKWNTLQDDVYANLQQNGFYAAMRGKQGGWKGNSIPYREDSIDDPEGIANYLEYQWLGRDWVNVEDIIKDEIVCTVQEIFSNAFEHGNSLVGVFSCGQHYPSLQRLKLTVIDFGVGIPFKVSQFLKNPEMPPEEALQWAFQPGKSTRKKKIPGGIGLDTLKRFLREKRGRLEVYSGSSYALISSRQECFRESSVPFEGTLLNITIRTDINCYT